MNEVVNLVLRDRIYHQVAEIADPHDKQEEFFRLLAGQEIQHPNLDIIDYARVRIMYEVETGLPDLIKEGVGIFHDLFNDNPSKVSKGNGRVELIGNFTDQLEDGHAIGFPLANNIVALAGENDDGIIDVYSKNQKDRYQINLDEVNRWQDLDEVKLRETGAPKWVWYLLTTLFELKQDFEFTQGFDMVLVDDLPGVGGLSSSAALESAFAYAALEIQGYENEEFVVPEEREGKKTYSKKQVIRAAKLGENRFAGCGWLDQALSNAIAAAMLKFGKEGEASTFTHEDSIDLSLLTNAGYKIYVGVDENMPRNLANTGYGHKVECANRARDYLLELGGKANIEDLALFQQIIKDQIGEEEYKALYHLVSENDRVLKFFKKFKQAEHEGREQLNPNELEAIFELINASGQSSLENWGVADAVDKAKDVPELNEIIEMAKGDKNVEAVRTHGGGWTTTHLIIVHKDVADATTKKFEDAYNGKGGGRKLRYVEANVGLGSQAVPDIALKMLEAEEQLE